MNSASKYVQIRDELKRRILSGEIAPGARVPSEAELCRLYDVSRISAKRAMEELERDGYVTRKVGKGTYASFSPMYHRIGEFCSLSEEIRRQGQEPSSRLVCFERLTVGESFCFDAIGLWRFLYLGDEDEVYHIVCQRFRSGDLIALDSTYLPVKHCPQISADEIQGDESIYRIVSEKYGFGPISAWENYHARSVNDQEAHYLHVTAGSPALKVLRVCSAGGLPLIYNWRVYRGETMILTADLGRRPGVPAGGLDDPQ